MGRRMLEREALEDGTEVTSHEGGAVEDDDVASSSDREERCKLRYSLKVSDE